MRLQLPKMMRGRNLLLSVLAVLLIALGLTVFKVDQPVQPNGPAADEIMATIDEVALAAGATIDRAKCRMITKQYLVVICEIKHMRSSEATRKLVSDGWTPKGDGSAPTEFSRGKDHLTIEDGQGGALAVSVIRHF